MGLLYHRHVSPLCGLLININILGSIQNFGTLLFGKIQ